MEKSIRQLGVVMLLATICACNALAADARSERPERPVVTRPVLSRDFRIDVATNRNTYLHRDVLRLAVKLLNNSQCPAFVGICPVERIPVEPVGADGGEADIEDVDQGFLDGVDVDVAIMPPCPIVIGYATLIRLGPSPVPCPVPGAEESEGVENDETNKPKPRRFRLPLFSSPWVPGHSTRIISTANILMVCPPIEPEPEPTPVEVVPADVADGEPVDIIPAIGRYVALKPGYYLLNCYIERLCGTKLAQAQKIVRIRRRIPKPVPEPEPVPEPVE